MIHAYDKLYLDKARQALARMLDYAVYELGYDLTEFWNLFLHSDIVKGFESGNCSIVVGRSGVELVLMVLGKNEKPAPVRFTANRSEEYWTGWALAYYQWWTGMRFEDITTFISIDEICSLYSPYHEMDIRHFVVKMNDLYSAKHPDTNLKCHRLNCGLSQGELASLADVPVRTIQQYEQRKKNINKAQVDTVLKLAQVLNCSVEDLLERAIA